VRHLCALLVACIIGTADASPPAGSAPSDEEYRVYVALLAQRFTRTDNELYVIRAETDDGALWPSDNFDGASLRDKWDSSRVPRVRPDADTMDAFSRIRTSPAQLEANRLNVPAGRVVSKTDIASEFERQSPRGLHGLWEDFHKRHGGGYVVFSRVGFNRARDQAVLSYSYFCGGLCAGGVYVLMHKVRGNWRSVSEQPTWVS
jgi:hypothetical protein